MTITESHTRGEEIYSELDENVNALVVMYIEVRDSVLVFDDLSSADLCALDLMVDVIKNYVNIGRTRLISQLYDFVECMKHFVRDSYVIRRQNFENVISFADSLATRCFLRYGRAFEYIEDVRRQMIESERKETGNNN